MILASGVYPLEWKSDRRIPLFKKGSKLNVTNFRMIAIHSVFRKLFNKIMERRVRSFVKLDDAQAGFRPKRRTTDHAFVLHDLITRASRNKAENIFVIVLDFSYATFLF